jgi:hypothetical protein
MSMRGPYHAELLVGMKTLCRKVQANPPGLVSFISPYKPTPQKLCY